MEELFMKIKIFKSNRHYRLGDLFYCKGGRFSTDIKTVLRENLLDQQKHRLTIPGKLLTLDHNIATHGESTTSGKITLNCVESFNNFHTKTNQNTNTTLNTTMMKQSKLLRKNTHETLSILVMSLANEK